MTRLDKFATSLLKPINPSIIIVLGIYTVVWGLWLMSPYWSVFGAASLYSAMASVANEYVWGGIAVGSGLVIMRGAIKPSYSNLHMGAFVACLHWLAISLMYFIGDWMNTGGITSLTFAIYAGLIWLNIKANKKLYQSSKD